MGLAIFLGVVAAWGMSALKRRRVPVDRGMIYEEPTLRTFGKRRRLK